jgi:exopolysaccharide production protein ExoQ
VKSRSLRPYGRPPKPEPPSAQVAPPTRWVRDDGYTWLLAIVFWLIFYQNLPHDLAGMASNGPFADPNASDRLIKMGMLAISCYLIANRWLLARNLARHLNPGFAGYFILAPLSMLWSISPVDTLLRSVSLAAVLMVCFSFGLASWTPRRFQRVALPPLLFIMLASLLIGAISPRLVIEAGTDVAQLNAWHGISGSKNEFGMLSSFGVIICFNQWLGREGRANWALLGAVASFTCVLLSRSNTSLFACSLAVLSMVLMMRVPLIKKRYTTQLAISIAVLILIYELVIQRVIPGVDVLLAPVLGLTGKDTTFSARTTIWRVIKDHIALSPWVGSGYGAYWVGAIPGTASYIFLQVMYLYPSESHNGYLEVMNDLGVLGLICLLVFIIFYIRQALQLIRTDRSQGVLYLALLFQEMVMDMSESDWFSRSGTAAILGLASICLSRALLDVRLRAMPPVAA